MFVEDEGRQATQGPTRAVQTAENAFWRVCFTKGSGAQGRPASWAVLGAQVSYHQGRWNCGIVFGLCPFPLLYSCPLSVCLIQTYFLFPRTPILLFLHIPSSLSFLLIKMLSFLHLQILAQESVSKNKQKQLLTYWRRSDLLCVYHRTYHNYTITCLFCWCLFL